MNDLPGGFILSMQGVGEHHFTRQIQPLQQEARSGDFIALSLGDHRAKVAASPIDRIDDLLTAVPELLAIDDDEAVVARTQDLRLPRQKNLLQDSGIDGGEHAGKGGALGRADPVF